MTAHPEPLSPELLSPEPQSREPLSPEMFDPHCGHRMPIRVGDKWSGMVLRCLQDGPRRFTELKVPLKGVAPKVLTETLRAMERDGWLTRTAYDENPPRVEYALTPLGHSLLGPMDVACDWAREHLDELPRTDQPYARPGSD